jgi:hypothetical protein
MPIELNALNLSLINPNDINGFNYVGLRKCIYYWGGCGITKCENALWQESLTEHVGLEVTL